jgi:hypothetical protein
MIEELSVKRLQLLKEVIPGISRVALLWYTGNLGEPPPRRNWKPRARSWASNSCACPFRVQATSRARLSGRLALLPVRPGEAMGYDGTA